MTLDEYCALNEARFMKSGYWRAKSGVDVRQLTHEEAQIAARVADGTCRTCGAIVAPRHMYCARCMKERRREQSRKHKASVHMCKCGKEAMPSSSRCKDCDREYKAARRSHCSNGVSGVGSSGEECPREAVTSGGVAETGLEPRHA